MVRMDRESRKWLKNFAQPFQVSGIRPWACAEKSGQESVATSHKLPEAEDPFRTEDGLPDRRKLDCQHDDAGQQGYRQ
jgi:hypothetical protein